MLLLGRYYHRMLQYACTVRMESRALKHRCYTVVSMLMLLYKPSFHRLD